MDWPGPRKTLFVSITGGSKFANCFIYNCAPHYPVFQTISKNVPEVFLIRNKNFKMESWISFPQIPRLFHYCTSLRCKSWLGSWRLSKSYKSSSNWTSWDCRRPWKAMKRPKSANSCQWSFEKRNEKYKVCQRPWRPSKATLYLLVSVWSQAWKILWHVGLQRQYFSVAEWNKYMDPKRIYWTKETSAAIYGYAPKLRPNKTSGWSLFDPNRGNDGQWPK